MHSYYSCFNSTSRFNMKHSVSITKAGIQHYDQLNFAESKEMIQ